MRWTRRDVLRLGLAGLGSLGLGCRAREPRGPARPRYVVTILLSGGMDAIWTTDPREPGEVEAGVDVPYAASAIVEAGGLRLGPHLAPFAAVAERMSVVNGVQVGTANHNWGWLQFDRLRTHVDERMPVIGALLGEARDGQPLAVLQLPRDEQTFRRIERASRDDRRAMAAALARQRRRLGDAAAGPSGASLEAGAALLERSAAAGAFAVEPWIDGAKTAPTVVLQLGLQRTLWALENDLAACVQLSVDRFGQPWDSHWDNARVQAAVSSRNFPLIARFLGELGKRRNAHGVLADQTLVVIGSELGRFPRLNGALGKDHWPEVPLMFWGAGIVPGRAFGQTGRHLQAQPVSLRTGRGGPGGELITLDDVGTTLLQLRGIDPAPRGYVGRRLDFLVAT